VEQGRCTFTNLLGNMCITIIKTVCSVFTQTTEVILLSVRVAVNLLSGSKREKERRDKIRKGTSLRRSKKNIERSLVLYADL